MPLLATTFGSKKEFERGRAVLDRPSLAYEVLSPDPGFRHVGAPAVVTEEETRRILARSAPTEFLCAGWVEHRETTRIRLIALTSGDLGPALPYLNAEMERASFNPRVPVLTFMDGYRMVALHSRRITVAKADEVVDGRRTLESVRRLVESVWARRHEFEPDYHTRERPPALEIFKRLPGTNCKECGEPSCLAFAVRVWSGEVSVTDCAPVFADPGVSAELRGALEEVCAALGV